MRAGGPQGRNVATRERRKRFLIVCEGARTEPNYFEGFRVNADVTIEGPGVNTVDVVRKAQEINELQEDAFDEVWCVFDRDSFPAERFNAALEMASARGFHVAYSNEAFEIWYLLHFEYYVSALSRTQYGDKLSKHLGVPYRKKDPSMYDQLLQYQAQAIKRAEKLLAEYNSHRPVSDNPCTSVQRLVVRLNEHSI